MKNLLFCALLSLAFASCKNEKIQEIPLTQITGETMATYYKVSYRDSLQRDFKPQIDSLLVALNKEVNTYDKTSTISQFNQATDSLDLENNVFAGNVVDAEHNKHFITNLLAAKQVWSESEGAFDPTVMPLVNYWGFGYTPKRAVVQADSVKIDSLMQYVGFQKIDFNRGEEAIIKKELPGVMIDFSSCAKGYGVDAVARYLTAQGIRDCYVEIGGESVGYGNGSSGNGWTVAIGTPKVGADMTEIQQVIRLNKKAIATSGNYRNFYEVDGKKYAHTISPKTGFPKATRLLSASVFTDECMMSDAYATACMVLGLEKAKTMVEKLEGVEALFIYSTESGDLETVYTAGVEAMLVQ